jgi:hypothetical protein
MQQPLIVESDLKESAKNPEIKNTYIFIATKTGCHHLG